jgi:hypothetical protein
MKNKNEYPVRNKFSLLSELGFKLDLSFSSQMSVGNKVIALDGIKKKLLVLDTSDETKQHFIIHLDRVKSIAVKKKYCSIKAGDLKRKEFEEFLETIFLHFEYREGSKTVDLHFYERGKNRFSDVVMLERNARNWQLILSKMIVPTTGKQATEKNKVLSTA